MKFVLVGYTVFAWGVALAALFLTAVADLRAERARKRQKDARQDHSVRTV